MKKLKDQSGLPSVRGQSPSASAREIISCVREGNKEKRKHKKKGTRQQLDNQNNSQTNSQSYSPISAFGM